jgi:hypothetical protein
MLEALQIQKNRLENMRSKVVRALEETVKVTTHLVEDLNAGQLNEGVNADNQNITPPYAELTKQIKKLKGQPTDRVTLKDTGAFHRSFNVMFETDGFMVDSKDELKNKLVEKYGAILGLTDKSKQQYINDMKEALLNKFRQIWQQS